MTKSTIKYKDIADFIKKSQSLPVNDKQFKVLHMVNIVQPILKHAINQNVFFVIVHKESTAEFKMLPSHQIHWSVFQLFH